MEATRCYIRFRISLIIFFSLIILISGGTIQICLGNDNVSIHPGHINIELFSSDDNGFANHTLVLKNNKSEQDIYYYATDFVKKGNKYRIPAEYLKALTPYNSDFESLDNPILFLTRNHKESEVAIRLSGEIWNEVPGGDYWGYLLSPLGKKVDVKIRINKSIDLLINPRAISINASGGSGFYQGNDKVTVKVNNDDCNWILNITAESLKLEGAAGNSVTIPADNLYLAVDDPQGPFYNLAQGYQLEGCNYGNMANIDFYLQAEVEWGHQAGRYKGNVVITVSE